MQAFDVELLRRLILAEIRAGGASYPTALLRLRYSRNQRCARVLDLVDDDDVVRILEQLHGY